MTPIDFPQSNTTFTAPLGTPEGKIHDIKAFKGEGVVIVCLKPDAREIAMMAAGAPVWVSFLMPAMPSMAITLDDPWVDSICTPERADETPWCKRWQRPTAKHWACPEFIS